MTEQNGTETFKVEETTMGRGGIYDINRGEFSTKYIAKFYNLQEAERVLNLWRNAEKMRKALEELSEASYQFKEQVLGQGFIDMETYSDDLSNARNKAFEILKELK